MKLLSQQEAIELIQLSWKEVERHTLGSYRFGQALCNNLPIDLYRAINNTKMDFYYETNCDKVIDKFYKYCVESA